MNTKTNKLKTFARKYEKTLWVAGTGITVLALCKLESGLLKKMLADVHGFVQHKGLEDEFLDYIIKK